MALNCLGTGVGVVLSGTIHIYIPLLAPFPLSPSQEKEKIANCLWFGALEKLQYQVTFECFEQEAGRVIST